MQPLDVLDELEKVPGHAHEAQRLKEILRLGFHIPDNREDLMVADRASELIGLDRSARALEVLDEGLSATPKDNKLLALKAMALALQGKFEQAMELQKACGHFQLELAGSYCGLGDCLLKQGKPDLAIRSFGGREPHNVECAKVMAWAYAQTEDFALRREAVAGRRPLAVRGPERQRGQVATTGLRETRCLGRTSLAAHPGGGQR